MIVKTFFGARMGEGSSAQVRGRVSDEEVEPFDEGRVQILRIFRLQECVSESPTSADPFFAFDSTMADRFTPSTLRWATRSNFDGVWWMP